MTSTPRSPSGSESCYPVATNLVSKPQPQGHRSRHNTFPKAPSISGEKHTVALVTTISTSPLLALINIPNLSHTPLRMPSRLFSASVLRKFLTVSLLAPACFCSSATISLLSPALRVGMWRMLESLASLLKRALR